MIVDITAEYDCQGLNDQKS